MAERYSDFLVALKAVLTGVAGPGGALSAELSKRVYWDFKPDAIDADRTCVLVYVPDDAIGEKYQATGGWRAGTLKVVLRLLCFSADEGYPFGALVGTTEKQGPIRLYERLANAIETVGGYKMSGTCAWFEFSASGPKLLGEDSFEMLMTLTAHFNFSAGSR